MASDISQKIIYALKFLVPLILVILLFLGGVNAGVINFEAPKKIVEGEVTATLKLDFGDDNTYSESITLVNATVYDFILEITKSDEFEIKTTYWEQFDSHVIDSITYKNVKYESDSSHYWSYYVNGEPGMEGADKVYVKNDDLVEWRFIEF
jgi:hypothetical protein